jgi:hypothetical protein
MNDDEEDLPRSSVALTGHRRDGSAAASSVGLREIAPAA